MRLSDIRQGRTIYLVSVFPECDAEFQKNNGRIERCMVMSRPVLTKVGSKLIHRFSANKGFAYLDQNVFCNTWRIGADNTYNMHKAFLSRRKAEAYQRRIVSGCLTIKERLLLVQLRKQRVEMDLFFAESSRHMMEFECPPETSLCSVFAMQIDVRHPESVINIQGV